jgi:hypothetical protein
MAGLGCFASSRGVAIDQERNVMIKRLVKTVYVPVLLLVGLTTSALAQGVLQATADLTGDGVPEKIYNAGGGLMRVVNPNGTQQSYFITTNPGGWAILGGEAGIKDMDGVAGGEMAVNAGAVVIVVTHRTTSTRSYSLPSNGWALLGSAPGITDYDGVAGAEVPINMGTVIHLINHRAGNIRSYATSSGTWFLLPGPGGINDFDGAPGNDLAITVGGTVRIIHPGNGITRDYFVTSGAYSLSAVSNLDGLPGQELTFRLGTSQTYRILNDRAGVIQ